MELHVVLVAPEIHWNTGNIGRTCLGVGACLHLVKPLGFSIDDKAVKRAGLDYWKYVKLFIWEDYDEFISVNQVRQKEIALLTKLGKRPYWEIPSRERLFLVFGSETKGLPSDVLDRYSEDSRYYIPIRREIRSLNLSSAVAVVVYDSVRKYGASIHQWSVSR